MSTIYDVSLPISESLIVWPGSTPIRIETKNSIEKGDVFTASDLITPVHMGTHVDAPKHFISGGKGIETLSLDTLVGWARVVHALDVDALTAEVLENLRVPKDTLRLLIRTRNSDRWAQGGLTHFEEQFVAVTEDGARWLVDRGIRLVGVDYLSVAPYAAPVPTHRILLEDGVIPLEGLNLVNVPAGMYQLVCLPLKIVGADGAPARTILISNVEVSSGE
jgi:arylformamidase